MEGRGDEVVVCNVVLASIEWWRKDICDNKTQSIQLNMAGLAVNAFQMNLLGKNEINFNLPGG